MSDTAPVSSKELLDLQTTINEIKEANLLYLFATTECTLTLKDVCDMIRTHS